MRHENLAPLVVVQAPLVAAAMSEHLKLVSQRMKSPNAGAQFDPITVRRAGLADARGVEHALVTVEPTIRSPQETVQALVRVLVTEAVEHHLRRTVRHVVVIAIGNEQQFRRRAHPHTAVSNLQTGHEVQSLGKHLARLKLPIAIAVLEDDDLVQALSGRSPGGITIGFRHPDAPAFVPGERDRLLNVRFCRHQLRPESFRQIHLRQGLLRRRARLRRHRIGL